MTLEKVAVGLLALVGGVVGGALSGGVFTAARSADAAPPGGPIVPPLPPTPGPVVPPVLPKPPPPVPIGLNPTFVPTVMTVPIGGLVFKSADGKVLAKLHGHEGGALFTLYNAAGVAVASIGADEAERGGRLALSTRSGQGCFIGLGTDEGGRLDLYHPQAATPRVTLASNDPGHYGSLMLRDIRPLGISLLPNDIYNLHAPK